MCNAGFAVAGFAEDIQLEELRLQFETNFFGAVAVTKAVLPTMRKQRLGNISQISSIARLAGRDYSQQLLGFETCLGRME